MTQPIAPVSPLTLGDPQLTAAQPKVAAAPDFLSWIERGANGVSENLARADHAVQLLATGQADSLPEVMLAMQNAITSLSLMVQVRDRLVSAYQEVLQMQI